MGLSAAAYSRYNSKILSTYTDLTENEISILHQ